jgi:hypothetical protein
MSRVIGRWIIRIEDRMPSSIRNSAAWRDLLPLAAGTGRAHEAERLALILDWMWGTVLPAVQPVADARGLGPAWRTMCEQRTPAAAEAAAHAAGVASVAAMVSVADLRDAGIRIAYAAAAAHAAHAADTAAANANAAAAAAAAAAAGAAAAAAVDYAGVWRTFDPVGLLRRLIAVTDPRAMEVVA